jgi:flagellar FliL protein
MADEEEEVEVKKSPLVKIILIAVLSLVIVAGSVVATLFFAGFFDKKDAGPLAEVLEADAASASGTAGGAGGPAPAAAPAAAPSAGGPPAASGGGASRPAPQPKARQVPERVRFEQSYLELERPLLANVTNSRKVIQVRLAVMTYYDERVFANIKKHEFAIRSAVLDVMRQATEPDIVKSTFRVELAERIRLTINALLEKYEDFGGVEEVHFTEFVFQ